MKNKILILFLTLFFHFNLLAEDLIIEAKDISIDKEKQITVFNKNVVIETMGKKIFGEYAELNTIKQEVIVRSNILVEDKFGNSMKTDYLEFDNVKKILKTTGFTTLTSSQNYTLEGEDIFFDSKKKIIKSNKISILKDLSGNIINLENFEYLIEENIFKSVGYIKIEDQLKNTYEFSQIYIDTKKNEIIGTDIKAQIKNQDFKIDIRNDPRIFANSMKFDETGSVFNKSVFTLCEYRKNEKCPPWVVQANKMTHDKKSKTIFYKNAVIKVYDIPIFFAPYLSHPDPSVDRRSGFLTPSFSDSKNLGSSIEIPYFWALGRDKNFTLSNRIFVDQHPLFLGEYNQAFKNSNLLLDFGFTDGYKKTSKTKKAGDKSHFFSKFTKNFKGKSGSENTLSIITQNISDKKYLKLYKIKSNLINYNNDVLENSLNFSHSKDDLFFGFNSSIYQTIKNKYNDKYEYIFPEITIDKNLISNENIGTVDLQTNLKVHNYDTNKQTNFFINELKWKSDDLILNSSIKNNFLGNFKNINYEAKNIDIYKDDSTNEFFGALGFYSEIDLQKNIENITQLLTPKFLLKFAPGSMRQESEGSRLTPTNAFNLERTGNLNNFETGNTATFGFDYDIKKNNIDKFNFSVVQIISETENKKHGSKSSLDEKLSDLVGESKFIINENINLGFDFAIDQNYQDFNYNDFNAKANFENLGVDFNYIQEAKHIGNQEYFKTKIRYDKSSKSSISFETKRNLITNSSEFYNLSYEYMNDCLRAGLVFRREFYNDSELEADNSLMFNITLVPFGNIDAPKINK